MATTKYADIITRIAMADRMVRMDLATVALESVNEEGQARLEVEERLCMPLAGFLRTYQEMGRLVQNLKDRGIIGEASQEQVEELADGKASTEAGFASDSKGKKDNKKAEAAKV